MNKESKSFEIRLQKRLKEFDLVLENFESMQNELREFNMIARREIIKTRRLLFDFSRTYSEKIQEDMK